MWGFRVLTFSLFSPHVVSIYMFSFLVFTPFGIHLVVKFLEVLEEHLYLRVIKVFVHELSHWIKVIPRLQFLKFFVAVVTWNSKQCPISVLTSHFYFLQQGEKPVASQPLFYSLKSQLKNTKHSYSNYLRRTF